MHIDQNRLNELQRDLGHCELREVVAMTLAELDACLTGQGPVTADECHFIKGGALTIGLVDLAQTATRLEQACRRNLCPADARDQLSACYQTACNRLTDRLQAP